MNKPVSLWLGLALLLGSSLLVWLALQTPQASRPQLQSVRLFPAARPLAPFELQDEQGQPFTPARLRGQWNLIFFGYTHCPDVCPGTLAKAARMMQLLENEKRPLPAVWFVSVDPERDTREKLAQYVHYFHPAFHAATGSPEALEAMSRNLAVVYFLGEKDENGHYEVDHSANLLLIDPQGRFAGIIPPPHDPAVMAADLARLTGDTP